MPAMTPRSLLHRFRYWLLATAVFVLLGAVVAPYVYIHVVQGDPPAELGFGESASSAGTTLTSFDGTWRVTDGSEAGYRVDEVLFGQDTEAVGRTSDVTGELTIAGTEVTDASFTVDLTTVESDESRRDDQFQDRIMQTSTYPSATFTLTEPIDLGQIPDAGEEVTVEATGDLTLHGVTQRVTFELSARVNGDAIEVTGAVPVTFADYDIADASFGPATVQDHGEIEVLLTFALAR
jgi:polyisoprenoid-binding protein YceI